MPASFLRSATVSSVGALKRVSRRIKGSLAGCSQRVGYHFSFNFSSLSSSASVCLVTFTHRHKASFRRKRRFSGIVVAVRSRHGPPHQFKAVTGILSASCESAGGIDC